MNSTNFRFKDGITPLDAEHFNKIYDTLNSIIGELDNLQGATHFNTMLNAKQNMLQSGIDIKTINNNSVLGSGNLVIQKPGAPPIIDWLLTEQVNGKVYPISHVRKVLINGVASYEDVQNQHLSVRARNVGNHLTHFSVNELPEKEIVYNCEIDPNDIYTAVYNGTNVVISK